MLSGGPGSGQTMFNAIMEKTLTMFLVSKKKCRKTQIMLCIKTQKITTLEGFHGALLRLYIYVPIFLRILEAHGRLRERLLRFYCDDFVYSYYLLISNNDAQKKCTSVRSVSNYDNNI